MIPWKIRINLLIGLGLLIASVAAASPERLVAQIKSGGHVLMLRHAYAPGTGDPAHFRIGDCAAQRNLDDQGRTQARQIGQWLRARGIDAARIFSSQWCRCLETATLLNLGPVTELPALNSFFERPQDREPNLAALRAFLARQPADGKLIVLVTHFVTISGITGEGVSSGQGVVLKLQSDDRAEFIGPLAFDLSNPRSRSSANSIRPSIQAGMRWCLATGVSGGWFSVWPWLFSYRCAHGGLAR